MIRRTWLTICFLFQAVVLLGCSLVHAQLLDLADLPVTIVEEQEPNLIVTLDDSFSMAQASSVERIDWDTKASRAYQYNRFAYNPNYTYRPPLNADGTQRSDALFAPVDANDLETPDLSTSYLQITDRFSDQTDFFVACDDSARPAEPLCSTVPAYYYIHTEQAGCDASARPDLESCYERVGLTDAFTGTNEFGRTLAEEQTNFANWRQFYITRLDAMKTILSHSFSEETIGSDLRLGRQTTRSTSEIESGPADQPLIGVTSLSSLGEREHFYEWLNGISIDSGDRNNALIRQSLIRAGDYISSDDAYRIDPRSSQSSIQTCRRNENLLVSPGDRFARAGYSVSLDLSAIARDDNGLLLPDGENYVPGQSPFYAGPDDRTAADISFNYWARDAYQGGADNQVPALLKANQSLADLDQDAYFDPSVDPATWQHLRTTVVGFGLQGTVPVADAASYAQLLSGDIALGTWRNPDQSSNLVDDLLHVAVNSRGSYGNIFEAEELLATLSSIVSVPGSTGLISATATATGRTSSEELFFTTEFDSELNIGRLKANRFSDGSEFVVGEEGSSCNDKVFGTECEVRWDAARKNTSGSPSFTNRKIFSYDPDRPSSNRGVEFDYTNFSAAQQQLFDGDDDSDVGRQRLDYVRGDVSNEIGQGGGELFRARSGPSVGSTSGATYLGPVVNSNPLFVPNGRSASGARTFNFDDDLESKSYSAFVNGTASQRPPLVFVGANDGMLHGFDASDTASGGDEELAYVPGAILNKLAAYSEPNFRYSAFVDGPLVYQDAFVGNEWKSMLVGGLRTGGQAYFALDISNAGTSNLDADELALWEFSDEQDADLGYSFGTPQIVRSNDNGRWVVLVPSGYNSTEADDNPGSGRAYLFVLDAEDGEVIEKIPVGTEGGDDASSPNGLSSVAAVTVDDDINVEYAYVGDLKGRLWRIDMRSSNTNRWRAGLLFDAGEDRPITAKPVVGRRPDGGEGRIVYFGTGQLLQSADIRENDRQAFYGVLDDDSRCRSFSSACVSASDLVEQDLAGASAEQTISSNAVNYDESKGFVLPLSTTASGAERVISEAVLVGATVAFTSTFPEANNCGSTTENFLYVINRASGGQPPNPPLIDSKGEPLLSGGLSVVGIKLDNEFPVSGIELMASGDGGFSINTPAANPAANLGSVGRLRWRQLR